MFTMKDEAICRHVTRLYENAHECRIRRCLGRRFPEAVFTLSQETMDNRQ